MPSINAYNNTSINQYIGFRICVSVIFGVISDGYHICNGFYDLVLQTERERKRKDRKLEIEIWISRKKQGRYEEK